jgi:phage minor structural protein
MNLTTVYDKQMQPVAYLENALKINYKRKYNDLWQGGFSLPADDPKNDECLPFRFVELFDGERNIGKFRIIKSRKARNNGEKIIEYTLEHALATLVDDVLFKYHQIGNLGVYTKEVLQYILDHQEVVRWKLGKVEFDHQFLYKWENEDTLLAALFSVPKPFIENYQWTFDTTTFPFTINLVKPSNDVQARIRYAHNLAGITRTDDMRKCVTRLYALGYGEGVNQLAIEDVNPTGLPYIDADTQDQFGIIKDIWVDRRFENADSLFNSAKAYLEEIKVPPITYKVQAADLYKLTNDSIDKFENGAVVHCIDDDLGIEFEARVKVDGKPDVTGAPGDVTLEIANKAADIGADIGKLRDRQRIHETYAQGSGSMDSNDYADNCDATHPAKIISFIHGDVVNVNEMLLTYETEAFRAYSQATEGGGATTVTSASGGSSSVTSNSGGSTTETTDSAAAHSHKMFHLYDSTGVQDPGTFYGYYGRDNAGAELSGYLPWFPAHIYTFSADGAHSHSVSIPSHSHVVDIPSHSHDVVLPDHVHDVKHGIYELGTLPTGVTVKVDGNVVSGLGLNETNVNIVPYLSKDSNGRIERNKNHVIEITPNGLGRISATVVKKVFSQSRGQYTK